MLSIVLALASTIVAVIAGEYLGAARFNGLHFGRSLASEIPWGPGDELLYACASMPMLLAVVDSIEGFMGTAEAAAAVTRAAGLVAQSTFLYRCRAGDYADASLARSDWQSAGESSTDLSTLRQVLLTRDLATISHVVDASGALLSTTVLSQEAMSAHGSQNQESWAYTPTRWPCMGKRATIASSDSSASAVRLSRSEEYASQMLLLPEHIDGDAYIRERVHPELVRSLSSARWQLLLVLFARICSFAAAAAGTAIAVAAFSSPEGRWVTDTDGLGPSPSAVAITISISTAAARMLQTSRAESRRRAHARAASALNAARVRWESLPCEERRQLELDRLVLSVEQAIEATLPPATSDVAARKASSASHGGSTKL